VAKELFARESLLPWQVVATELQRMELRGEIRRGYFVEGLSGMQYALPSAVEELRRIRSEGSGDTVLLNACDPANPYGTGIDLQSHKALRIPRLPGNFVAFVRGVPVLLVENSGSRLSLPGEPDEHILRDALTLLVKMTGLQHKPLKEIVVEYCDGERPAAGPIAPILRSLGFRQDRNQIMRYDGYP
jgi:ATP-dependent Lhr-like helicase